MNRKNILIVVGWLLVIAISVYFYYVDVEKYFTGKLEDRLESEKLWLIFHFTGAACILFLGPLQFWPFFRNHFWKWHRIAGKIYIAGSVISALMVFYLLSNYPIRGAVPSLGLLAVIWLFCTLSAYWFASKKNFKQHKHFMIRSYICGIAFIFIRLLPFINDHTGMFNFIKGDELRRTVYEWMCWVYPLIITEFFLVWRPLLLKQAKPKAK